MGDKSSLFARRLSVPQLYLDNNIVKRRGENQFPQYLGTQLNRRELTGMCEQFVQLEVINNNEGRSRIVCTLILCPY